MRANSIRFDNDQAGFIVVALPIGLVLAWIGLLAGLLILAGLAGFVGTLATYWYIWVVVALLLLVLGHLVSRLELIAATRQLCEKELRTIQAHYEKSQRHADAADSQSFESVAQARGVAAVRRFPYKLARRFYFRGAERRVLAAERSLKAAELDNRLATSVDCPVMGCAAINHVVELQYRFDCMACGTSISLHRCRKCRSVTAVPTSDQRYACGRCDQAQLKPSFWFPAGRFVSSGNRYYI